MICWMFMFIVSVICFIWMHWTVMKMSRLPTGFDVKFASLLRGGASNLLQPLISWEDEFSVGVKAIDHQHTRMVNLINEIDEVVQEGGAYELFSPILNDLFNNTKHHFAYEEELLLRSHCPNLERHKRAHVQLLQELQGWRKKVAKAKQEDMPEHMVFLRIWLPGHILNVDKHDADYLVPGERTDDLQSDQAAPAAEY